MNQPEWTADDLRILKEEGQRGTSTGDRKKNRELELRREYMHRLPFCSDHRDKVIGKPCRECEIERLKGLIRRVIAGRWSITELQEAIGDV